MPQRIHQLTHPGELSASAVVCGSADAAIATWDRTRVTCDACLGRRTPCTCGPGLTPCPACLASRRTRPAARAAPPEPPPPPRPTLRSEKAFQEALRQAALAAGWHYFHPRISLQSAQGYPDLTVVRGDRLLFAELKMPGQRPTPAQQRWLDALAQVTSVSTFLWYPDALPQILEVLR